MNQNGMISDDTELEKAKAHIIVEIINCAPPTVLKKRLLKIKAQRGA